MKNKVKTVFRDNIWLSVVAIIMIFILGIAGWKSSLSFARVSQSENSIRTLAARETEILNIE